MHSTDHQSAAYRRAARPSNEPVCICRLSSKIPIVYGLEQGAITRCGGLSNIKTPTKLIGWPDLD